MGTQFSEDVENQFKIEKAIAADHLIFTQITSESKAFWGYSREHLDIWKPELTITQEYILENEIYKLIVNNETFGYYSFYMLDKDQLQLDNLFLLPNYIGKGFGKILLQDFLERVKNFKFQSIILEADSNAENFYEKFGFKTYNLKESWVEDRFLPQMKLKL